MRREIAIVRALATLAPMRTASILLALSSTLAFAQASERRPVIALMPPTATDDDLRGLGMMMIARASELIEASSKYSELHVKQVLAMADAEGLNPAQLSDDLVASQARTFLGADRLVTVTLTSDPKGITLAGTVLDGMKATPFRAKLAVTWPEALAKGSEAIARAVFMTAKVPLPAAFKAQPESKSPEAVRSLAECYAIVIRQPLGIDNPAVLDGAELDRASALCEKALKNDKELKYASAVLSLARAIVGDHQGAAIALASLGSGDDMVEPFTLARFWMVTRFQSNEDGLASLKDVMNKHPGELIALNYLADTLGVLGNWSTAESAWKDYLTRVPASPFAHGRLSKALARQGKHPEAIAAAKKALELAPQSRVARLELGSRYIDAGKADEAIAIMSELPEVRGEQALRLGWAHWLKGSPDTAATLFQKALDTAKSPGEWRTRGRAHYNLALVEMKRGKAELAKAALRASIQTGYKLSSIDPSLEKVAKEVEREDLSRAIPDAGTKKGVVLPSESSLVPFGPTGDPDLAKVKDAAPQGFVIYKF